MNLRRIITVSTCLLIGASSSFATVSYMTVELKAGDKYSFLLTDKPVVTFNSGDLVVNGDAETSYSIEGVKNFHFTEGDATGAETLSSGEMRIASLDGSTIQVQNIGNGSIATLVNVSGKIISSSKADSEGSATISLPQTKGVYILSADGKSFKIIRK